MDPYDTDPEDLDPKDADPKDADPRSGSGRDIAIIVGIAVLMSAFAVFMLSQAFPPK